MKRFLIFIIGIIFTGLSSHGQDMTKGFQMLETGEFQQAESFFKVVLDNHPNNKTARICFGRATGLSGNPSKALGIFDDLDTQYPNDIEVLLNKSECYLWLKDGQAAIRAYSGILASDNSNFAATLGIANSYSMEKEYTQAYEYILKAEQQQPNNGQVSLSKKYIILGLANQLASEKNAYDEAQKFININLQKNPTDQETLTLKATVHLIAGQYKAANSIYQQLNNPLEASIGQSVSLHLLGEDKQALAMAKNSLSELKGMDNTQTTRLQNHYISALLWNNKIKEAQEYSDSLSIQNPTNQELILSQAQIAVYASDYTKGVKKYSDYLESSPTSFNANLGKADAIHALGMDNIAYGQALKAAKFYPGQKDITSFIQKLNKYHSPQVTAKYMYGKSSDGSEMQGYYVNGSLSIGPLSSAQVTYQRKRLTSKSGTFSSSETYAIGGAKRFNSVLKLTTSVGHTVMDYNDETGTQSRWDFDAIADIRVNKSLNMSISYLNEIQDFNEALLKQNLKIQHIVVKNSLFWKLKGIGSYTEAYRSYYSDGNRRNLAFTSLYKTFNTIKPLKVGANYLYMGFKESIPTSYYSPEQYHQTELFTELNFKEGKKMPVSINWSIAGGYQIADQMSQPTWRTAMNINKEIGRVKLHIKGGYSTIVAMQTNGFSHFTLEGGIRIKLTNRPIFYKSL